MNRQENYPMKVYFKKKNQAQASIEFSLAFVTAILFLLLSCNLFVWLNHNIVQRQKRYEETRIVAGSTSEPGKLNFYTPKKMNLFVLGGYK